MIVVAVCIAFLAAAAWPAYHDLWNRRDDVRRAMKGEGNDDRIDRRGL